MFKLYIFNYRKNEHDNFSELISKILKNNGNTIFSLNPYLLSKYFFDENSEVLHSAFLLLTYAYKHT